MPEPLLTLTTDFGTGSPYVAAMKGVILSINPAARLLDLGHAVPPQDVRHAAFFLAEVVPWFPPDTIHVVVVDPGVGSARAILHVAVGGQRLLVPDNGCWGRLEARYPAPQVVRVTERRFWRPTVSATFHGRDVFAPVAAHLSLGLAPAELGPAADDWVKLPWPEPARGANGVAGEIVFVDDFGNLIGNVPGAALPARPLEVRLGNVVVPRLVRTYADAAAGDLVALVGSGGLLEIAVVGGSAARRLGLAVGAPLTVGW
jgi:S-adenosylmethionine hydrolase